MGEPAGEGKLSGARAVPQLPFDKSRIGTIIRSFSPSGVPVRFAVMSSQLLEEAMKKIPNQQQLVNVVSKRVKQLSAGHRPMVDFGVRMGFADIALTEIIDGKLTFDAPTTLPLDRY